MAAGGERTRRRAPRVRAVAALAAATALALVAAVEEPEPPLEPPSEVPSEVPVPAETGGEPSLSVPSLQSVVGDDRPLRLAVRVTNAAHTDRDDLRVVVTVHGRLTTRFALQQSLDDAPTTGVVHAVTRDVRSVPARGSRTVRIAQTTEELGFATLEVSAAVHPVRIALQSEGEVVDEVVTAAVVTGRDAVEPLQVGVLLPLTGPPAELPDGRVEARAVRELIEPGAAVPTMLHAVQRHAHTPVTLAVDGLTLATLERVQGGVEAVTADGSVEHRDPDGPSATAARHVLERLRGVAGQSGVDQIPLPYGRADLVALTRYGAASEAARHVGDDTGDIERLTGQRPQARTLWPAAGINAATLRGLRGAAEALVLSEDDLRTETGRLTPPPLRQVQTSGAGTLRALVADAWIQEALSDTDRGSGALMAARVVAEVASVHLEQPAVAGRGLLIAPPADQPLHGAVVEPLLAALDAAAFAELTDLAGVRATGADGDVPQAQIAYPTSARLAELPGAYVVSLREAREHVGSLDALVAEGRGLVARLDRRLLQAASTAYRDEPAEGLDLIEDIDEIVADLRDSVTVPEIPPVTLAAEEGTLPVRLSSTADVPLNVRVTLRTAAYEVRGGPTHDVELPPNQDQLLSFDVRALAPGGTSPVQVVVTDPHGINELASGTVVVRSAAFSVAGVIVTTAAALFLIGALWRQLARRRRPAPAPASAEDRTRAGAGR